MKVGGRDRGCSVLILNRIQTPRANGHRPRATYSLVSPDGVQHDYINSKVYPARCIALSILSKRRVHLSDPEHGRKHVHIELHELLIAREVGDFSYRLFRASEFASLWKDGIGVDKLQRKIEKQLKKSETAPCLSWDRKTPPSAEYIDTILSQAHALRLFEENPILKENLSGSMLADWRY